MEENIFSLLAFDGVTKALVEVGNYPKAVQMWEIQLKLFDFDRLGSDYLSGDPETAKKKIKESLARFEGRPSRANEERIKDLVDKSAFSEAVTEAEAELLEYPKGDELYRLKGRGLDGLGQPEEALKSYHKTLELNPKNIRTYFDIGGALIYQERFEESFEFFEKFIAEVESITESDLKNDISGYSEVDFIEYKEIMVPETNKVMDALNRLFQARKSLADKQAKA